MPKKRQSKRLTCRKKYKIIRKVREHHKKVNKALKGKTTNKRKDPGVPNKFPFKEEFLNKIIETKEKEEEERENYMKAKKQEKKLKKKNIQPPQETTKVDMTLEEFMADINRRTMNYANNYLNEDKDSKVFDNSYRRFHKVLDEVIKQADIIIQVLDIRDPLGTRCPELEKRVYSSGPNKQLILLLNKIDLVPREVTQGWLKYLRQEYPTLAFKASTKKQKSRLSENISNIDIISEVKLSSGACFGAQTLIQFLKSYKSKQSSGVIGHLTVGVVGMPNVGKSSVINSIKKAKVCPVGANPGITKTSQSIKIDNGMFILDSPGVIFPSIDRSSIFSVEISSIDFSNDTDYLIPLEKILSSCPENYILDLIGIPSYGGDLEKFLFLLSRKFGKMKKGGKPDKKAAARVFLAKWKNGDIKYYYKPPDITAFEPLTQNNAENWKEKFDFANVECEEDKELDSLIKLLDQGLVIDTNSRVAKPREVKNKCTLVVEKVGKHVKKKAVT